MYPVFIYTLNCPTAGRLRYVGQTVNPDERLRRHIKDARKEKYHNACWIKSLLSKNLRPVMEILDVVPDDEADFWEREYIQNFRERGFDLTNILDGGEGFEAGEKHPCFGKPGYWLGKKLPSERCAQISAATTGEKNPFFGKKHPPEIMAKIIAANIGKPPNSGSFKPGSVPWNKGTKGAQIAWNKGKPGIEPSLETRAKMSAAGKGRTAWNAGKKAPPETCAKMSASRLGKKRGPYKNKNICPTTI